MKTIGIMHPTDIAASPDTIGIAVLVAATGQAFDVPAGAGFVSFGADCNFIARYGSTSAQVPTSSSTAGSTSGEVNPTARNIGSTQSCTGISLISATSGIVTMSWYSR